MRISIGFALVAHFCLFPLSSIHGSDLIPKSLQFDWPTWRGPTGDNVAPCQQAPLHWGKTNNVVWKTPVPGRGHSSPVVVGDHIFLTTADEKKAIQSVLAFHRQTGRMLWKTDLFQGGLDKKAHKRNTQATCTVACDGQRVFASFMNGGAVWVTALDLEGKQVWQTKVGPFVSFWGYSASPALYKSMVLVAADHSKGGYLAALNRETGKIVWKQSRPKIRNYPSPVVHNVAGRNQLLIAGCDLLASYDPNTGKPLWSAEATTEECVGTIVTDGGLVFASGGYPKEGTVAVRADGSGEIVWQNPTEIYAPSLLAHDGYLYTATDKGVAICWQAATGKVMWKERLGGVFNSSPVLVGDRIYVTGEEGRTYIFRADPGQWKLIATNDLGDEVFATPAICGGRIFMRVAERQVRKRQEWLYCIGQK